MTLKLWCCLGWMRLSPRWGEFCRAVRTRFRDIALVFETSIPLPQPTTQALFRPADTRLPLSSSLSPINSSHVPSSRKQHRLGNIQTWPSLIQDLRIPPRCQAHPLIQLLLLWILFRNSPTLILDLPFRPSRPKFAIQSTNCVSHPPHLSLNGQALKNGFYQKICIIPSAHAKPVPSHGLSLSAITTSKPPALKPST